MKRTESLKRNYEFARIYRKGKYFTSNNLTIYVLKKKKKRIRIGITVSKKSYGRSVDRNRIRRLVRESYRSFEEKISNGWDIVFVARKNSKIPTFKIINEEVKYLLKQSGLI